MVYEPLQADALGHCRNVHVAITLPGVVRGNHYHLVGTETIATPGPALVRFREKGILQDVLVPDGAVYRFTFPPKTPHAIRNTGSDPVALVAFTTETHHPDRPDVVREVLIPAPEPSDGPSSTGAGD